MPRQSSGILLYRIAPETNELEVLIAHPGGPFWQNKDIGAWSIIKGEFQAGEDPLATAMREFNEETGSPIAGKFEPLQPVQQKGGKIVHAFAVRGDFDPETLNCNLMSTEFPPRSGKWIKFPEIDRVEWCTITVAREKLNPAQTDFLDQLIEMLGAGGS
jgi:predicted NUDIX family NTP pyrophosphohydrolase